ncbi:MAG: BamA/TamA family outer membrane protein [Polyangiales bacterium]
MLGFALSASADDGIATEALDLPRYRIARIQVHGARRTQARTILGRIPLRVDDALTVADPMLEECRWRLLGTGWFRDVRLELGRGNVRGTVVLHIHVRERNTLVIEELQAGVAQGIQGTTDTSSDLEPYGGIAIAERNFLGLGQRLALHGVASQAQQGLRLSYTAPHLRASPYGLRTRFQFNHGREFFGNDPQVSIACAPVGTLCPDEILARNAVVFYKRYAWSLGTERHVGHNTHYGLDWQADVVSAGALPDAASEGRGGSVRPLDFAIDPGRSFVSMLSLHLRYDHRDRPVLTGVGNLLQARADLAGRPLGSDYDFIRVQADYHQWWPLPWSGQSLRFGIFAGALGGRAPFFYKFYAADLSDLIPSRALGMTMDRRAPPDLLSTSIAALRAEELAGRVDLEYAILLKGRRGALPALQAYANLGLYALGDAQSRATLTAEHGGLQRLPVDLTFDIGLRFETHLGYFQLGFSTLLGFITP